MINFWKFSLLFPRIGAPGPPGKRGKRGKKGDPGDAGSVVSWRFRNLFGNNPINLFTLDAW